MSLHPHFVDKRFYPHRLIHPPPPALIHISNFYNIKKKLSIVSIFKKNLLFWEVISQILTHMHYKGKNSILKSPNIGKSFFN